MQRHHHAQESEPGALLAGAMGGWRRWSPWWRSRTAQHGVVASGSREFSGAVSTAPLFVGPARTSAGDAIWRWKSGMQSGDASPVPLPARPGQLPCGKHTGLSAEPCATPRKFVVEAVKAYGILDVIDDPWGDASPAIIHRLRDHQLHFRRSARFRRQPGVLFRRQLVPAELDRDWTCISRLHLQTSISRLHSALVLARPPRKAARSRPRRLNSREPDATYTMLSQYRERHHGDHRPRPPIARPNAPGSDSCAGWCR